MSVRAACALVWLALAWLALACKDPGVIGEISACVPSCDDGMLCDTAAGACVACLSSDDCGDDARCVDNACVPREIRDPEDDGDREPPPGDDDESDGEGGEGSPEDGEEDPPGDDEGEGSAGEGDES